ncbi:hypothetical protein ACLOJK_032439 [Asimina triloba]
MLPALYEELTDVGSIWPPPPNPATLFFRLLTNHRAKPTTQRTTKPAPRPIATAAVVWIPLFLEELAFPTATVSVVLFVGFEGAGVLESEAERAVADFWGEAEMELVGNLGKVGALTEGQMEQGMVGPGEEANFLLALLQDVVETWLVLEEERQRGVAGHWEGTEKRLVEQEEEEMGRRGEGDWQKAERTSMLEAGEKLKQGEMPERVEEEKEQEAKAGALQVETLAEVQREEMEVELAERAAAEKLRRVERIEKAAEKLRQAGAIGEAV